MGEMDREGWPGGVRRGEDLEEKVWEEACGDGRGDISPAMVIPQESFKIRTPICGGNSPDGEPTVDRYGEMIFFP